MGVTLGQLRAGTSGPQWRNQALAWIFMRLGLAQGEGQGLATMRELMRQAQSPPPKFDASEVWVSCTLFAHRTSLKVRKALDSGARTKTKRKTTKKDAAKSAPVRAKRKAGR